ncbi:hypothetical protein BKA70DRAFT_1269516, partial [Coprinopsis sp. MPI-PUGE-AT-0042]
MSTAQAVTISYTLNPPPSTISSNSNESLETSKTTSFPITSNSSMEENGKTSEKLVAFYGGLRNALAEAKNTIGDELTVWRDRVGKAELDKEPKARDEEDEEEEECRRRKGV